MFVGGGDVEEGIAVLREADLVRDFRAAARRGAVFAGMSAGAIMLGERWIRWPHDHAGDDEAETYECLGVAPCSLDTHGEDDGWRETRSFAAVRARELGKQSQGVRVPERRRALIAEQRGVVSARRSRCRCLRRRRTGERRSKRHWRPR